MFSQFFCCDTLQFLPDALIKQLHRSRVSTIVLLENITMVTTNNCGKNFEGGFVVLGTFHFVQRVFSQVFTTDLRKAFRNMKITMMKKKIENR